MCVSCYSLNSNAGQVAVIAYPEVSLGLSHYYGFILELSELHTCTHYPVIALAKLACIIMVVAMCILMTVTSCLQSHTQVDYCNPRAHAPSINYI